MALTPVQTSGKQLSSIPPPPEGFTEIDSLSIPPPPEGFTERIGIPAPTSTPVPVKEDNEPGFLDNVLEPFRELSSTIQRGIDDLEPLDKLVGNLNNIIYGQKTPDEVLKLTGKATVGMVKSGLAGAQALGSTVALPFTVPTQAIKSVPVVGKPIAHAVELPFQYIGEAYNLALNTVQKGVDAVGIPRSVQNLGLDEEDAIELSNELNGFNQMALQFIVPGKAAHVFKEKYFKPTKPAEIIERFTKEASKDFNKVYPVAGEKVELTEGKQIVDISAQTADLPKLTPQQLIAPKPIPPKVISANPVGAYRVAQISRLIQERIKTQEPIQMEEIFNVDTADKIGSSSELINQVQFLAETAQLHNKMLQDKVSRKFRDVVEVWTESARNNVGLWNVASEDAIHNFTHKYTSQIREVWHSWTGPSANLDEYVKMVSGRKPELLKILRDAGFGEKVMVYRGGTYESNRLKGKYVNVSLDPRTSASGSFMRGEHPVLSSFIVDLNDVMAIGSIAEHELIVRRSGLHLNETIGKSGSESVTTLPQSFKRHIVCRLGPETDTWLGKKVKDLTDTELTEIYKQAYPETQNPVLIAVEKGRRLTTENAIQRLKDAEQALRDGELGKDLALIGEAGIVQDELRGFVSAKTGSSHAELDIKQLREAIGKIASEEGIEFEKPPAPKPNPVTNAYKKLINWVNPTQETTVREYDVEIVKKGLENEISKNAFFKGVGQGKTVVVSPEMDAKISNRSRTSSKEELLNLIKGYKSYPKYRNEATLDALYKQMEAGGEMDKAILLDMGDGHVRVLAGNTRMDAAFQLGQNPKAILIPSDAVINGQKSSSAYLFDPSAMPKEYDKAILGKGESLPTDTPTTKSTEIEGGFEIKTYTHPKTGESTIYQISKMTDLGELEVIKMGSKDWILRIRKPKHFNFEEIQNLGKVSAAEAKAAIVKWVESNKADKTGKKILTTQPTHTWSSFGPLGMLDQLVSSPVKGVGTFILSRSKSGDWTFSKDGVPEPIANMGKTSTENAIGYADNYILDQIYKLNKHQEGKTTFGADFMITEIAKNLYESMKNIYGSREAIGEVLKSKILNAGRNMARMTYLSQLPTDTGRAIARVMNALRERELKLNSIESDVVNLIKDSTTPAAVKVRYLENAMEGQFTDIELAGTARTPQGQTVQLNLSPEEIVNVKNLRAAQAKILDLRLEEMLFTKDEEIQSIRDKITDLDARITASIDPAEIKRLTKVRNSTAINLAGEIGRRHDIETYFQSLKDKGYLTLKRDGKYVIYAENPNVPPDHPDFVVYDHARNLVEWSSRKKEFEDAGYTNIKQYEAKKFLFEVGSRLTPAEFDILVSQSGVSPADPAVKILRDKVLARFPTTSYSIKRDYIKGYKETPENFKRSTIAQMEALAGSNFRKIGTANAMKEFRDTGIDKGDNRLRNFVQTFINDETFGEPKNSAQALAVKARQGVYITQLGLDAMQFYLNAVAQPITQNYSYFARTEFGLKGLEPEQYFARAGKLMLDQYRKTSPVEFQKMYERLKKEDVATASFVRSLAESEVKQTSQIGHWLSVFHRAGERVTRGHAAAEAYLVGTEKLHLSGEALHNFMVKAIDATQGRFTRGEAPGAVRALGEFGRAGYQFSSFTSIWFENLALDIMSDVHGKRLAASPRHLAGLVVAAGITGLPAAGLARYLYKKLTNKDPDRELKNVLGDNELLRDLALYGITSFGEAGISARTGIANDIPFEYGDFGVNFPILSTIQGMYRGTKGLIYSDKDVLRNIERVTPIKGLKAIPRLMRYQKEGIRTPRPDNRVVVPKSQLTPKDYIEGAFGIQAEEQIQRIEKKYLKRIEGLR